MLLFLKAVVIRKNEGKKINHGVCSAWPGNRRCPGPDPAFFRPGRGGPGGPGEGRGRVAGAVHHLGRRHGNVLCQRRPQDPVRHHFPETGAQPEPDSRRRFHPAGARLPRRQVAVPARHFPDDGTGVGGDRIRPPYQGRGDPADDLVGRRPHDRARGDQDGHRPEGQDHRHPAGRATCWHAR